MSLRVRQLVPVHKSLLSLALQSFILFAYTGRTLRFRGCGSKGGGASAVHLMLVFIHICKVKASFHKQWDKKEKTHDLRFSPSFLFSSIVFSIAFRPSYALMWLSPMLMLIFLFVCAFNSLLRSKCFINRHTKTPQSLPFSCCGASSLCMNLSFLPNNISKFRDVPRASRSLLGARLS